MEPYSTHNAKETKRKGREKKKVGRDELNTDNLENSNLIKLDP